MFDRKKAIIYIEGMKCKHCAEKVKDAISSIDNIKKVKVDINSKCADLIYVKEFDENQIKKIISDLDYSVSKIEYK